MTKPKIRFATEGDMSAVIALRFEVFVDEQQVPAEIEIDEEDVTALHILAEDDGEVVGCARLMFAPLQDGRPAREARLGRLAVKKTYRGQGIGLALCRFAMAYACEQGYTHFGLHAQRRAQGFYAKLGFRPQGETYMEAGIEHVTMVADVDKKGG